MYGKVGFDFEDLGNIDFFVIKDQGRFARYHYCSSSVQTGDSFLLIQVVEKKNQKQEFLHCCL